MCTRREESPRAQRRTPRAAGAAAREGSGERSSRTGRAARRCGRRPQIPSERRRDFRRRRLQWTRAGAPTARIRSLCGRGAPACPALAGAGLPPPPGPDASRPGRLFLSAEALHGRPDAGRRDSTVEPAVRDRRAVARQRPVRGLLSAEPPLPPAVPGSRRRPLPAGALRDRGLGRTSVSQGGKRLGRGRALRGRRRSRPRDSRPRCRRTGTISAPSPTCPRLPPSRAPD